VPSPEPKRCLTCGYILDHLPEPRCPECGRGFDPNAARTYRVGPVKGPLRALLALLAAVLSIELTVGRLVVIHPAREADWIAVALAFGAAALAFSSFRVRARRQLRPGRGTSLLDSVASVAALALAALSLVGQVLL
jgi:hypothetical protein